MSGLDVTIAVGTRHRPCIGLGRVFRSGFLAVGHNIIGRLVTTSKTRISAETTAGRLFQQALLAAHDARAGGQFC